MRILLINKFLHPNGGSETYIFKLGDFLKEQGHEVQYFGMEHKGRCCGKPVNAIYQLHGFSSGIHAVQADLSGQNDLFLRGKEEAEAGVG